MKAQILLGMVCCIGASEAYHTFNPWNPELTIAQGTLMGGTVDDVQGRKYHYFLGIPYAAPPRGNLRFKPPVPPEPWRGIFNATKLGNTCIGRDIFGTSQIIGSEDCLFLNVYTRNICDKPNEHVPLLPVLFWIHGGMFTFGSGNPKVYGPDYLLTQDIVLVTINYRLGLFGFLNFEDASLGIPGNAGFKDMVMALRWVHTNIEYFGGDPKKVTVFGEGSGGASAHLLTLSPMAQGLFSRVIAQSGSALNTWAVGRRGGRDVALAADLQRTSEVDLLNHLMSSSPLEIFTIQEKMQDILLPYFHRYFGYVVEKYSLEPFLTETPIDLMRRGHFSHTPIIFGYNSLDGLYSFLYPMSVKFEQRSFFENVVPWNFGFHEVQPVADEIEHFYLHHLHPKADYSYIQYSVLTDIFFLHAIHLSAIIHASVSTAPVYFYKMSVQTQLNTGKTLGGITLPGACHFDDIGYLFRTYKAHTIFPGSPEDTALRRFMKLWTNFAATGNPTPEPLDPLMNLEWNKVETPNTTLLNIASNLQVVPFPSQFAVTFWKNLCLKSPAGSSDKSIC